MARDVMVLGAGIVGVSIALHLQARGRDVALVERGAPGRGTSYGNAGLIQREAVLPYSFPQDWRTLWTSALNRRRDVHYHLSALPKIGPALFRYWRAGRPDEVLKTARANAPLYELCLSEHQALAEQAGVEASLRHEGWMKAYRTEASLAEGVALAATLEGYGIEADVLDRKGVQAHEPHLTDVVVAGLRFPAPYSLAEPLKLTEAYAALFETRGGAVVHADARSLTQDPDGAWSVDTASGPLTARDAVLATGPWADEVFAPLGYHIPFFVKRGYHMHYAAQGNATLNRNVLDVDGGYMLAPMNQGVRLTTGAEFALRDAPPTPVQLARSEPWAREIFPLAERREATPWMGSRPSLPDMLPVIGPAPKHKGLWFAFGHAHHGLTLGAVTGRLVAEMVTGEEPFTDPTPYRADRF